MKQYSLIFIASLLLVIGCQSQVKHLNQYIDIYSTNKSIILDRSSNPDVYSVAACGFFLPVIAKTKPKDEAIAWVNRSLDFYERTNPSKNRGWLYHFHDHIGNPVYNNEVSTIDTAIFYRGASLAAEILCDPVLIARVNRLITAIDTDWMIKNSQSGKFFCHGLIWKDDKPVFFPHDWNTNDESYILYRLFNRSFTPLEMKYDMPIFVYLYVAALFNDPFFESELRKAIECHKEKYGYIVTATDTEAGYCNLPLDYTSPLMNYAFNLDRTDHITHSLNVKTNWKSLDRIGIDEGAVALYLLFHH